MKSPSACLGLINLAPIYLTLAYLALTLTALTALMPSNALAWGGYSAPARAGGHPGSFGWRTGRVGFGFYRRPLANSPYPYVYLGNSGYDPGCIWVRQLISTQYGPQWQVTAACAYGN